MSAVCIAPATGSEFLLTLVSYLGCQGQTIGSFGYQSISNSNAALVSSVFALFIAFVGLRLILGGRLSTANLLIDIIKFGFVAVLAGSWPAYKILVYDVVIQGPAEISAVIASGSGLPGSANGLFERLQSADNAMSDLILVGSGRGDPAARSLPANAEPSPEIVSDAFGFSAGKTAFLLGVITSVGLPRLLGGILLALAPIFALLLLFRAGAGLFFGWAKLLVATCLASIIAALILSVELALLESWLSSTLALRSSRIATPEAPYEFMAMAFGFSLILAGGLFAAFKLPSAALQALQMHTATSRNSVKAPAADTPQPIRGIFEASGSQRQALRNPTAELPSFGQPTFTGERATAIYASLGRSRDAMLANAEREPRIAAVPLGQTYRRTNIATASSAALRDKTT
jgi:type IV secretion system protein VirB6